MSPQAGSYQYFSLSNKHLLFLKKYGHPVKGLPEKSKGLPGGFEGLLEGPEGLPKGPEGPPEGPERLPGQSQGPSIALERWAEFLPIPQDIDPYWGCCPKNNIDNKGQNWLIWFLMMPI